MVQSLLYQYVSASFSLLNLLHHVYSMQGGIQFKCNMLCNVCALHSISIQVLSTLPQPPDDGTPSLFMCLATNLALLRLHHPPFPPTPLLTAVIMSETKGCDLSKSLRLPVSLFLWLIRLCNAEITPPLSTLDRIVTFPSWRFFCNHL